MYRILLVDDEEGVLNALRRQLSARPTIGHGDLEIETFTSPVAALERAAETGFDLVIADYLMPEMDGVEFLKAFMGMQPLAGRIILSGHADMEALVVAANEARIHRFVIKPWHDYYLKGAVAQVLAQRELELENRRLAEQLRQEAGAERYRRRSAVYQVMIVDDEEDVLNALARELKQHREFGDFYQAARNKALREEGALPEKYEYVVGTFTSPLEALKAAAKAQFDLVIADYAMPQMDGITFLEEFQKLQPDAARIMISGKADMGTLIGAINEAQIYYFIAKPWRDYELKAAIVHALAHRDLMLENRYLAERVRLAQGKTD